MSNNGVVPSPSVVRVAGSNDGGEVFRLIMQGHRESGLFSFAPEKVGWFLTRTLNPETIPAGDTGPRGVIGVIGPAGALEGMCLLMIGEFWYSHEKHLEEYLVYVDPEYRHSNHAKSLVEWMKSQSTITGFPLLTGIISKERTEAKCRLYRRMLPKTGEFFFWQPAVSMSSAAYLQ